jgi:hypothetical protein
MKFATLLLVAPLAGCWMPSYIVGTSASEWYDLPPVSRPAEDVVRLAREILARQGYRALPGKPGSGYVETDWDTQLSSHWREGYRTKVEVEVEATADGRSVTRVRSHREVNENGRNPLSASDAVWGNGSLDEKHKPKLGEPAIRVRQLLKMKLEGPP